MLFTQTFGKFEADKPSLVLVHGLFGNSDNLSVIRRHFEQQCHVLCVDLPEHGKSPRFQDWSFRRSANELINTLIQHKISSCYLVGHSLGGKVSMLASHLYPDVVDKLVVLDIAPVAYEPRHHNVINGLNSVKLSTLKSRVEAKQILSESIVDPGTISFLLKSLYQKDNGTWDWRFNLELIQREYSNISDWPYRGRLFEGNVTFLKGAKSNYITESHQDTIMTQFPNAKAKIVQAGHWLHAEKPQTINTLLTRILLDT